MSGAAQRMEEARRTLQLSSRYFERFARDEEQLARVDLQIKEFEALLGEL